MRNRPIFSAVILVVLCITIGFIAVTATLNSGEADGLTGKTVSVGDVSSNRKPFSCRFLGDEGGSGKPFSLNRTI